ncbi:hypothetical protein PR048_012245 [Dryococelus australis]|uniref:Uncharacterized protein n=1 Tax=Dryococelus australis TaxID=614101 RepID=A0ABQ9HNW8_9NEOP|nr:hypothetical protein PR048_012245 [Dryococelus australis]
MLKGSNKIIRTIISWDCSHLVDEAGLRTTRWTPVHTTLGPDVEPKTEPQRRVPFKLVDRLKEELDKMELLKVISKVEEPTLWANSMSIVEKTNGKLCICLDPYYLNKTINRPRIPTPNFENEKN